MATFNEFAADNDIVVLPMVADPFWLGTVAGWYERCSGLISVGTRNGAPMTLGVSIIDRPGINAFAVSLDDGDFIGIYRDVLTILRSTARGMVSQGLLCPEIATSHVPVSPRKAPGAAHEIMQGLVGLTVLPLDDPLRDKLADQIATLALDFILCHELAHILNGHTDWIGKHGQLSLIIEVDDRKLEALRGMERETLEWDADSWAINQVLLLALRPISADVEGRGVWDIPVTNAIGSAKEAVHCVLAALHICAAFFSSTDGSDLMSDALRSHPHPLLRMYSAGVSLLHTLSYRTGKSLEDFLTLIDGANVLPESWSKFFEQAPGSRIDDHGIAFMNRRIEQFNEVWARLQPELDELKRAGSLAPAEPQPHPAFPTSTTLG